MSGYPLIFIAAVLWSLIGVFSQGILDAGVGALEIAFWRALMAGAAFLVHGAATRSLRLERRTDFGAFAAFALIGVTLFYASLVLAIDTGGISLAFVLLYSAPAFVAVAAWLLLGERLTASKAALVAMAVAGVIMVSRGQGSGVTVTVASLAWGLSSGLSYASYYLFGKWVLARYTPASVYAYVLPLGALGLLPFVDFSPKPARAWLMLVVLALLSTYLAYLIYYTGLKRAEASRAVLVATVEPVVATLLAAALFGERLGAAGLVGGLLIVAAAALSAWGPRSRPGRREGRGSDLP